MASCLPRLHPQNRAANTKHRCKTTLLMPQAPNMNLNFFFDFEFRYTPQLRAAAQQLKVALANTILQSTCTPRQQAMEV